jgi:phospholipid/cholesterol/gamma-HCH transport system substrate-binding protein
VFDLRQMAAALSNVAEKVDRGGASSLIGSSRLPDYEPK